MALSQDLAKKFLTTKIFVALIETQTEDEARDLFIRLQAGLPLNAQEKRDAWPGGYTEFVLKFAGKPNNSRYPGHDFFKELISKTRIDRGQVRQLCAQCGLLFFEKAVKDNWSDIGTSSIDDYYYKSLGFDNASNEVGRFRSVLNKLYSLLGNRGIKKLKGHEAIHLILIVDTLMEGYSASWESKLLSAFENFREQCVEAKRTKDGDYYYKYVQWTMTSSDSKNALSMRHNFFTQKMYDILKPQMLDPNRLYGELEKEILYYKYAKRCQVANCGEEIPWNELQIHHVEEHHAGGQTTLCNGAPVHQRCHPLSKAAVESFASDWPQKRKC